MCLYNKMKAEEHWLSKNSRCLLQLCLPRLNLGHFIHPPLTWNQHQAQCNSSPLNIDYTACCFVTSFVSLNISSSHQEFFMTYFKTPDTISWLSHNLYKCFPIVRHVIFSCVCVFISNIYQYEHFLYLFQNF